MQRAKAQLLENALADEVHSIKPLSSLYQACIKSSLYQASMRQSELNTALPRGFTRDAHTHNILALSQILSLTILPIHSTPLELIFFSYPILFWHSSNTQDKLCSKGFFFQSHFPLGGECAHAQAARLVKRPTNACKETSKFLERDLVMLAKRPPNARKESY